MDVIDYEDENGYIIVIGCEIPNKPFYYATTVDHIESRVSGNFEELYKLPTYEEVKYEDQKKERYFMEIKKLKESEQLLSLIRRKKIEQNTKLIRQIKKEEKYAQMKKDQISIKRKLKFEHETQL